MYSFGEYCIFDGKIKTHKLDLKYPICPIRNILSRFSDKWSLLILAVLYTGKTMRYGEIKKSLPDISQKILTSSLKNLEKYHLIKRKAYAEIPPRVEYSLTETGNSLIPSIQMLITWAENHFEEILRK
ncbi:transcriptional regulator, HxlR family [Apibacter mensalis]|uniref:Transcriptional regulator, HxlR family n=1 Tax=Apibacter mensalis TaxID=1586267 RepID=A0A0X3ARE9_9FLAO|nr:helix-turn-helix domain-containing protein [Apibacter mensalis]CVK16956.1 transcriptional regulator, HxlR family [Apibacter mensalis]